MTSINGIEITSDHIFELQGESLRIYLWMAMYLPRHGYEVSYREIAANLQASPGTVKKAIDLMVDRGYLDRQMNSGTIPPTYKVLK